MEKFATLLVEHLNKLQRPKKTPLLSMSPILEWTIHNTARKYEIIAKASKNQVAGLAIFEIEKLRQIPNTILFRVSDVLEFLAHRRLGHLIAPILQKWAQNCDEYVFMGRIPDDALVKWIPWGKLLQFSSPLFGHDFIRSSTLAEYLSLRDVQDVELEDICQKIVRFAKFLAGSHNDLLPELIRLILRPRLLFWGFATDASECAIEERIHGLINGPISERLSSLSIGDDIIAPENILPF